MRNSLSSVVIILKNGHSYSSSVHVLSRPMVSSCTLVQYEYDPRILVVVGGSVAHICFEILYMRHYLYCCFMEKILRHIWLIFDICFGRPRHARTHITTHAITDSNNLRNRIPRSFQGPLRSIPKLFLQIANTRA